MKIEMDERQQELESADLPEPTSEDEVLDEEPTGDWSALRTTAVDKMIQDVEGKLGVPEFKASVGDYIRLIQIRKELGEERPTEIQVSWQEPSDMDDATA